MITLTIFLIIYGSGMFLSQWMMRTELRAEKEKLTNGQQVLSVAFSLLSWVMVLFLLAQAWYGNIGRTGYWEKPVKNDTVITIVPDEIKTA